jgi:hypothetical protein
MDPTKSFAAMYHRLRFTGDSATNTFSERILIKDLQACRTT